MYSLTYYEDHDVLMQIISEDVEEVYKALDKESDTIWMLFKDDYLIKVGAKYECICALKSIDVTEVGKVKLI